MSGIDYSIKITEDQATEIRRRWWNTVTTQIELGHQFDISPQQVSQIVHRKSWVFGPRVDNEPPRPN
jgi:hypothetical protein